MPNDSETVPAHLVMKLDAIFSCIPGNQVDTVELAALLIELTGTSGTFECGCGKRTSDTGQCPHCNECLCRECFNTHVGADGSMPCNDGRR